MGWNVIIIIIINLIFGFTIQGIDNAGHIGGLIGGFLATAIVHFPKKKLENPAWCRLCYYTAFGNRCPLFIPSRCIAKTRTISLYADP